MPMLLSQNLLGLGMTCQEALLCVKCLNSPCKNEEDVKSVFTAQHSRSTVMGK